LSRLQKCSLCGGPTSQLTVIDIIQTPCVLTKPLLFRARCFERKPANFLHAADVVASAAILAKESGVAYPVLLVIRGRTCASGLFRLAGCPAGSGKNMVFSVLFGRRCSTRRRLYLVARFSSEPESYLAARVGLVCLHNRVRGLSRAHLTGLPGRCVLFSVQFFANICGCSTAIRTVLRLPQRIVTRFWYGESLINDATALVAYRFALRR